MTIVVGQQVTVGREIRTDSSSGYGGTLVYTPGSRYQVSRVSTHKALVKHEQGSSAWIMQHDLGDPEGPLPRALGQTPDGDAIAIDDPRIQWIWDDAAKVADLEGYCSYYDKIAEKIGAPGRPRNYRVSAKVNGLQATFMVQARSRKLAEAEVHDKVVAAESFEVTES